MSTRIKRSSRRLLRRSPRRSSRKSPRRSPRDSVKKSTTIPFIIHQIWIGDSKIPTLQQLYMNTCNNIKGWRYRLWTNKDITPELFPKTYEYIQRIIAAGIKMDAPRSKYAQISDLMRLELLYHHGGVYMDTTIECLQPEKLGKMIGDATFVVSNEDTCEFNCIGFDGKRYISNSFIGSTPRNPILRHLLMKKNLNRMNFMEKRVNVVSGPYYLGEQLHTLYKTYDVTMLPSRWVYPHGEKNDYRDRAKPDKCLHTKRTEHTTDTMEKNGKTFYIEYPCKSYPRSFLIKHFNAGGSWIPAKF